ASTGVLIGWDKVAHFLPGFVLSNVFAHAHLAAIGWATLMVVGVGYRLLPMILAAKMPTGRSLYVSAIVIETGVIRLFASLRVRPARRRRPDRVRRPPRLDAAAHGDETGRPCPPRFRRSPRWKRGRIAPDRGRDGDGAAGCAVDATSAPSGRGIRCVRPPRIP